MPTTTATAMMMYFQSGYRFMGCRKSNDGAYAQAARWTRPLGLRRRGAFRPTSERLQRAFGQELRDRSALHGDLGVGCDLHRDVLVADLRDAAEDPACRDDLVALL